MRYGSVLFRSRAELDAGRHGDDRDPSRESPGRGRRAPGNRRQPLFQIAAGVAAVAVVAAVSVGVATGRGHRIEPTSSIRAGTAPTSGAKEPASDNDETKLPSRPAVISARRTGTGSILVGDGGLTLYVFSADRPGLSSCTGTCAKSWLPARSHGGKPHGSGAVPVAAIGSIQRHDGTYQITFYRQPLYYYVGDHTPGQARGQGLTGFGGSWQVATTTEQK